MPGSQPYRVVGNQQRNRVLRLIQLLRVNWNRMGAPADSTTRPDGARLVNQEHGPTSFQNERGSLATAADVGLTRKEITKPARFMTIFLPD